METVALVLSVIALALAIGLWLVVIEGWRRVGVKRGEGGNGGRTEGG